jgi:hypothetical protein
LSFTIPRERKKERRKERKKEEKNEKMRNGGRKKKQRRREYISGRKEIKKGREIKGKEIRNFNSNIYVVNPDI